VDVAVVDDVLRPVQTFVPHALSFSDVGISTRLGMAQTRLMGAVEGLYLQPPDVGPLAPADRVIESSTLALVS